MAESVTNWLQELKKAEWGTKDSLLIYCFAILIIETVVIGGLRSIGIFLPANISSVIIVLSLLAVIITWSYKWLKLRSPQELVIGIAIKPEDEEVAKITQKVQKALTNIVNQEGLGELIKFRRYPSDLSFSSADKAEKFITKNGIRVLVWGDALEGSFNKVDVTRFDIKISYQFSTRAPHEKIYIESILKESNKRGNWDIQKTNSLPEIKIVAGNVAEMSLFTLAVCLESLREMRYVLAALKILESLHKQLESRLLDVNFPNLDYVKLQVQKYLIRMYMGMNQHHNWEEEFKEANEYAEKALLLDPSNGRIHQDLSTQYWRMGDSKKAKEHTHMAARLLPRSQLPKINLAFLDMAEGKHKKGLARLKRLKPKFLRETSILKVIDFDLTEFERTENPVFLFMAGWFNYKYADAQSGRQELTRFMSDVGNSAEFDSLVVEAKSLISGSQ